VGAVVVADKRCGVVEVVWFSALLQGGWIEPTENKEKEPGPTIFVLLLSS
jgi:hypothetical protein